MKKETLSKLENIPRKRNEHFSNFLKKIPFNYFQVNSYIFRRTIEDTFRRRKIEGERERAGR